MELVKRTFHYIKPPQHFEIICPICNSINLAWSEYEKHIWCYDCEKDINNYISPMDGPVPLYTAQLLGICLDIFDMVENKVYTFEEFHNKPK